MAYVQYERLCTAICNVYPKMAVPELAKMQCPVYNTQACLWSMRDGLTPERNLRCTGGYVRGLNSTVFTAVL